MAVPFDPQLWSLGWAALDTAMATPGGPVASRGQLDLRRPDDKKWSGATLDHFQNQALVRMQRSKRRGR